MIAFVNIFSFQTEVRFWENLSSWDNIFFTGVVVIQVVRNPKNRDVHPHLLKEAVLYSVEYLFPLGALKHVVILILDMHYELKVLN